ncbi:hypothetical protein J6590_013459 [Homalodisca vitripennis]|nr:hypothetical protein J6590_013459 [Homalodisca vitripennis]
MFVAYRMQFEQLELTVTVLHLLHPQSESLEWATGGVKEVIRADSDCAAPISSIVRMFGFSNRWRKGGNLNN